MRMIIISYCYAACSSRQACTKPGGPLVMGRPSHPVNFGRGGSLPCSPRPFFQSHRIPRKRRKSGGFAVFRQRPCLRAWPVGHTSGDGPLKCCAQPYGRAALAAISEQVRDDGPLIRAVVPRSLTAFACVIHRHLHRGSTVIEPTLGLDLERVLLERGHQVRADQQRKLQHLLFVIGLRQGFPGRIGDAVIGEQFLHRAQHG